MALTKSKIFTYSFSMVMASFFVGCGGGGGSTSTSTTSSYSVSGTVPGTLIEAYCSDGSFYSTSSTNNGTSEHPFSLDLPVDAECKLVMITNETATNPADYIITPIEIENDSVIGTYLKIDKDIDLGNVPLETPNVNSGWTPGVRTPLKVTINGQTLTVKSLANDPMDDDNDGIPNVYEDDDNDGKTNKHDDDDDNDGIKDVDEDISDHDHDGIDDIYDNDDDNDGIKDSDDDDDNENDSDDNSSNENTSTTVTLPTSFTVNDGRLLGSQCAQCHGTNGVSSSSFDSIKGEDNLTHEIYDDDPIMNAQAKGYTSSEIIAIENWLNNQ
jgi:hypothetical protein